MEKIVLLIFGGQEEAEISLVSAETIYSTLCTVKDLNIVSAQIDKTNKITPFCWKTKKAEKDKIFKFEDHSININGEKLKIDYCIPCIHGAPGEDGQIQNLLEFFNIPYLGNNSPASQTCFNKITAKLWLDKLGIDTTPFSIITTDLTDEELLDIYKRFNKSVFVKASSQGSSIGCYPVSDEKEYLDAIKKARQFGDHIIVEEKLVPRELEVAVFEFKNDIHTSGPGEVVNQDEFYSFDAKYSRDSKAITTLEPLIDNMVKKEALEKSKKIFKALGLRDMARIDFFLTNKNKLYLNEINTFPGLTEISLFPQLVNKTHISFKEFILDRISQKERK